MITIILLISLFSLLSIVLRDRRAWHDETSAARNELVFEGRPQDYGAYVLRRDHDRHMKVALLTSMGVIAGLFGSAYLFSGEVRTGLPIIPRTHVTVFEVPTIPDPSPRTEARSETASSSAPKPTPTRSAVEPSGLVEAVDSVRETKAFITDTTTIASTIPTGGGEPGGKPDPIGGGGPAGGGTGSSLGGSRSVETSITVEILPEFPGGEAAMYKWVRNRIVFPATELGADKIYVEFVVGDDGSVRDVKAVKGRHQAYKDEAVRVVKAMPKWKAARMGGQDVPCRLVLPISFEVRSN